MNTDEKERSGGGSSSFGGRPPKPPEERFSATLIINVHPDDMKYIRKEAEVSERSYSSVGREAIEAWIQRREKGDLSTEEIRREREGTFTESLMVNLREKDLEEVRKDAVAADMSLAAVGRAAVEVWIRKKKEEAKKKSS